MSRALIVAPKECPHEEIISLLNNNCGMEMVQHVHRFPRALSLLNSWPGYDVVFVSSYMGEDEISEFLERAREKSVGYRATYILLIEKPKEERFAIANNLLLGFHGVQTYPFETEAIQEIINLSTNVHNHDSVLRLRVATGLMLTEMRERAGIALEEDKSEDINKQVEASCEWYKNITGKSVTVGVIKTLQNLPPTKRTFSYKGVSQRVKELFERPFALLLSSKNES